MDSDIRSELGQMQRSLEKVLVLLSAKVDKVSSTEKEALMQAHKRIEQLEKQYGMLEKELKTLRSEMKK